MDVLSLWLGEIARINAEQPGLQTQECFAVRNKCIHITIKY